MAHDFKVHLDLALGSQICLLARLLAVTGVNFLFLLVSLLSLASGRMIFCQWSPYLSSFLLPHSCEFLGLKFAFSLVSLLLLVRVLFSRHETS